MGLNKWLHPTDWPEYYLYFPCDCSESSHRAFVDWWSLVHLVGGIVGALLTLWMPFWAALLLWLVLSILFEVFENSDWGIWLSKILSCSADYEGDHLANSVIDVMCNMLGFGLNMLFQFEIDENRCIELSFCGKTNAMRSRSRRPRSCRPRMARRLPPRT